MPANTQIQNMPTTGTSLNPSGMAQQNVQIGAGADPNILVCLFYYIFGNHGLPILHKPPSHAHTQLNFGEKLG